MNDDICMMAMSNVYAVVYARASMVHPVEDDGGLHADGRAACRKVATQAMADFIDDYITTRAKR